MDSFELGVKRYERSRFRQDTFMQIFEYDQTVCEKYEISSQFIVKDPYHLFHSASRQSKKSEVVNPLSLRVRYPVWRLRNLILLEPFVLPHTNSHG